jgi:hypothetical protein
MDPIYNKVREMDEEEQQKILGMHSITTGAKVVKTAETAKPSFVLDDDEEITPIDMSDDNIELMDWNLI